METFARSLLRSPTELIVALGPDGSVALRTDELADGDPGLEVLAAAVAEGASGWRTLRLGGVERVGYAIAFDPFGWTVFVTEASAAFYRPTERIVTQTAIILGASLVAALLLLFFFAGFLTRPLRQIADAMQGIITTGDLSRRVQTLYRDETGRLGHTFNLMTADLERAYGMVKGYALRAAVAKENEEKIRHIFQKYVPKAVIDQFYASPEQMLVGEMRALAVLFSDIRGFTTLVENIQGRGVRPDPERLLRADGEIHLRPARDRGQAHRRRHHGHLRGAREAGERFARGVRSRVRTCSTRSRSSTRRTGRTCRGRSRSASASTSAGSPWATSGPTTRWITRSSATR